MLRLVQMLVTLFSFAVAASEPGDWNVHIEFRVVTLPQSQALALFPALRDAAKADATVKQIDALITDGKAQSLALLIGEGESGKPIESGQVEEVRYATEFHAPAIIERTGDGMRVSVPEKERAYSHEATQFAVRRVGIELKATPVVAADGRALSIEANPTHVRLLGWTETEQAHLPDGKKLTIKQPRFAVSESKGRVGLLSGERVLLGVHSVPGTPGQVELFLFRAWTTPRKK